MPTQRGNATSYKSKYQSSIAAALDADASIAAHTAERDLLRSIGTDTITKLGESIQKINTKMSQVAGCLWFANSDGTPIVHKGDSLAHDQTLLADADNVLKGVQLLCSIIEASEVSMSKCVDIIKDLQSSHDKKKLLSNESILSRDAGRGIIRSAVEYEVSSPVQTTSQIVEPMAVVSPAAINEYVASGETDTPRTAAFGRPSRGKGKYESEK